MDGVGAIGAAVLACLVAACDTTKHASIAEPAKTVRQEVSLRVANDGGLTWNGAPLQYEQLDARLAEAEKLDPKPDFRVIADPDYPMMTPTLGKVIQAVMAHGLMKIGFVVQ